MFELKYWFGEIMALAMFMVLTTLKKYNLPKTIKNVNWQKIMITNCWMAIFDRILQFKSYSNIFIWRISWTPTGLTDVEQQSYVLESKM